MSAEVAHPDPELQAEQDYLDARHERPGRRAANELSSSWRT